MDLINQNNEERNIKIRRVIIEILGTIIGSFIMAIGVSLFLLPNQLSSGGVAGIATITYYLFNIPMGTMMILINVPLFLISIFKGFSLCFSLKFSAFDKNRVIENIINPMLAIKNM